MFLIPVISISKDKKYITKHSKNRYYIIYAIKLYYKGWIKLWEIRKFQKALGNLMLQVRSKRTCTIAKISNKIIIINRLEDKVFIYFNFLICKHNLLISSNNIT